MSEKQKYRTNNPAGRPHGAKNKVSITVKSRIAEFVEKDFDRFQAELEELEPKDRVKAKIELIKLVVPRPMNEDEKEALSIQSALFQRLSRQN